MTRRDFANRLAWAAAGVNVWSEAALAQRALVRADMPGDTVWLNANENPEGPGQAALEAMREVMPRSWRYHYQEFGEFYATVSRSEGFGREHVVVGAGSSEVLSIAVGVFTSPSRPLIAAVPTFELPEGVARSLEHPVVRIPLADGYTSDVKRMAAEAEKAGGGLIYLCNPNNPTSTITGKGDLAWLVSNLPANTVLLVDEAYLHFSESPELETGLRYVREGKDVVVARTFSKIYGMAGLRIGFSLSKPELTRQMEPFRNSVISIVSARAAKAALAEAATLIPQRRTKLAKIRASLCAWLRERNLNYLEPHANFVMVDLGREVTSVLPKMYRRGVAPGRPFPPLTNMMRVTIGTEAEMEKFKKTFAEVMSV
ncbi:MAG TPA: aminotransferase class I/II-fold pyridoxal phosphate-dependent enzyme [Bryobacteraceae bacterium]|nr:aminotransferase class I/II-fold pyridoxal phosphate-dependent enzyme [Bryobacteraceae bacterium]